MESKVAKCTHVDEQMYEMYEMFSSWADLAHETAHEYQWGFGGERFMDADESNLYAMLMKELHIAHEQRTAFYERNSEAIERHTKVLQLNRQRLKEAEAKAKEVTK